MTSRTLQSPEVVSFPASFEAADSAGAAFASPLQRATARAFDPEFIAGASSDQEGRFLRGIAFALAVEACAALAFLGIWRLFEMIR